MAQTRRVVERFGQPGGVGEKLQQKLLERAELKENWLAEWWTECAYLGFRPSVVINSSPAVGYNRQQIYDADSYVRITAQQMLSLVKWNLLIKTEALPPDVYRNKPYCMSQYDLFSCCRIPGKEVDTLRKTDISNSRHCIVIRNGHFFKLDVLYEAPDGGLAVAPPSHIVSQLHSILELAREPNKQPVGILTSEHRDTWYQARECLLQDPRNKRSLDVIETAQFVFCLDSAHPHVSSLGPQADFQDPHYSIVANRVLHGNGSMHNTCNRWYDTSSQTVVGEDGGCGSILEHSAADGPASIASNIFVMDLIHKHKYDILSESSPVESSLLKPAEMLQWNISAETADYIHRAIDNNDRCVQDVDLQIFTFKDYGKNFVKAIKVSPDGFIQNAIQLAYYKLYGKPTAAYESGGTRWFRLGRTDTIRSTTNAAFAFVKTMSDPSSSTEEKAKSLLRAIKAHSDYTNDAISGQAVDRHLLGLKLLLPELGVETPDIFKDAAFSRSFHWCLSTSQVPVADHHVFLCFGAVVEDGYGVCYNPQESQVIFCVSSFKHHHDTDSLLFGAKLLESMRDMHKVMAASAITAKL